MSLEFDRKQYAEMFGPTVGDQVRLGDTDIFIEVERDLIAENGGYGNEIKFGGGKVIRELVELTGAKIDIEDDGTIKIAATDPAAAEDAQRRIHAIVAEPEAGMIYDGKVVKIMDFGAFVNFLGPKDGLVHISEMRPGRVRSVTDVVNEGDAVKVKCLGFDDRGKVRLTMKNIDQETGEEVEPAAEEG